MKKFFTILILFSIIAVAASSKVSASDYEEYLKLFESLTTMDDGYAAGYKMTEMTYMTDFFESISVSAPCRVYPAVNEQYGRAALFFSDDEGNVIYKTEALESNNFYKDALYQPNVEVVATAKRDVNGDGLKDILLITRCVDGDNKFKIGDVLFQGKDGFYRDWRISDKINRFSMNKDLDMITAFVRDGYSAEFLYSAATLKELTAKGFNPLAFQTFDTDFEKFGSVKVVPGTYTMGGHHIFMVYLVNTDGQIVWNFQCMRDYDNFSHMLGLSFKDVDGDGWGDLSILAEYRTLDDRSGTYIVKDFSIYYQRDGYFFEDTEFRHIFINELTGKEAMDDIIQAARKYWGWWVE